MSPDPAKRPTNALIPTAGEGYEKSARWVFLRDVLVFQAKMFLSNLRDFALMPVSLGAALLDLVVKGEQEGARFYKVLQWGSHSDELIDVYSAVGKGARQSTGDPVNYTVDAIVARLESVVVRECQKGGTAATVKAAMDRTMDQIHRETSGPADMASRLLARANEKLRR